MMSVTIIAWKLTIPGYIGTWKSFGFDAEVVGDGAAEAVPILGGFAAPEIERGGRGSLSAWGMAFVVRDLSVPEAPWRLDRVHHSTGS